MTLLEEWIDKAESDYHIAVILNRPRREPVPDGVCYHCPQSAEKYLKAFLIHCGVAPRRTYDLEDLLTECCVHDTSLSLMLSHVQLLSPYSVQFRYPGATSTVAEAKTAGVGVQKLRRVMRKRLGVN